jgi:hypothetical protein
MNRASGDVRAEGTVRDSMSYLSREVCAICQCRLTVHQQARGGICDDPECRRRKAVACDLQRRQEKAAAVRRMAVKYCDEMSPRLGVGDPASLRLAIIPYYNQPVVKLSRKRRAEFRTHLAGLLRQAFDGKFDSAAVADLEAELRHHAQAQSDDPAIGAACTVCTGFCCREGGTRAYLEVGVIRSYMARHPGMRLREVAKAYLSKLPDATSKGSCVYHGPRGCGLPREMRSSLCNTHYCGGMKDLRNEIASEGPKTVLLVAADEEGEFLKSAVIEPDGKTMRLEPAGE